MIAKIVAALVAVVGIGATGVYFATSPNVFGPGGESAGTAPAAKSPCCAPVATTCDTSAGGCCDDSEPAGSDLAAAAAIGGCAVGCEKK